MNDTEGFTIPELLIALFVGAAFILAAYQLFGMVIADGGKARAMASASNLGYVQLRQTISDTTKIGSPCQYYSGNSVTTSNSNVTGLGQVTTTTTLSCPIGSSASPSPVTLVQVTVAYNSNQHVTHAVYASPR